MTQINPLLGSILQTPQVQKQQAAERGRVSRQNKESREEPTKKDDEIIREVETGAETAAVEDSHEHPAKKDKSKNSHPGGLDDDSEDNHIDLTA